jgi:hypothetical protein
MENAQLPESNGLEALIQSEQYVNTQSGEPVSPAELAASPTPGTPGQQTPVETAPVEQQAQQGVTTQPAAPAPNAELERYKQIIQDQQKLITQATTNVARYQISQIQEADRKFREGLDAQVENGDITPQQAMDAIQSRERDRAKRIATRAQQERDTLAKQAEASRNAIEKNLVVNLTMSHFNLPDSVRPLLERSETPEDLDATLAALQSLMGTGNQDQNAQNLQQAQQQSAEAEQALARQRELRESGALIAGGENAGTPPIDPPQERSGDILGLISATSYQQQMAQ